MWLLKELHIVMRRTGPRGLLLIATLLTLACGFRAITRDEVIGKYAANHGRGQDLLEIRADGKWVQRYVGADGTELMSEGPWEFESHDGTDWITFREFTLRATEQLGIKGLWGTTPTASWWSGRVRLGIDDDLGYYYEHL